MNDVKLVEYTTDFNNILPFRSLFLSTLNYLAGSEYFLQLREN